MAYLVRPMAAGDLAQVTEIDRDAFPTQLPPANYQRELEMPLAHYLIAADLSYKTPAEAPSRPQPLPRWAQWLRRLRAGQPDQPGNSDYVAGFAGIWLMVDEAHITNIAVREKYQRRGIGELLLASLLDFSMSRNARFMTLEVRVSNHIAQELYKKYGFVEVGRRKGYYLDNREDAVIMSTESLISTDYQQFYRKRKEDLAKRHLTRQA